MAKRRTKKRAKQKQYKPKTYNMAKSKKRKSSRRRGRRMSGTGKGADIVTPLVALLSAVGSSYSGKLIPATVNPKIVAGVKLVGGGVLAASNVGKSETTRKVLKAVGTGIMIEGGLQLGKEMGILSGMEDTKGLEERSDFALEISDDMEKRPAKSYSGEYDEFEVLQDEFLNDGADDLSVINDEFLNEADDMSVINDDDELIDLD